MSIVKFKKTLLADTHGLPTQEKESKLVIAVDGPSASGKGTLAKNLAERLNFAFLDTGALYRAVALATLELGGDPTRSKDVAPALAIIKRNLTPELLANAALRTPEVSAAASKVAALPEVRTQLLDYQRHFAHNPPADKRGVILDGRDIGSVVCPDADIKLFVTASAEERARRRFAELKHKHADLTLESVLQEIQQRDARDSGRAIAPTLAVKDAVILDTTYLTAEETLDAAIAVIRLHFSEETTAPDLKTGSEF
jgi:cytidylate kinase